MLAFHANSLLVITTGSVGYGFVFDSGPKSLPTSLKALSALTFHGLASNGRDEKLWGGERQPPEFPLRRGSKPQHPPFLKLRALGHDKTGSRPRINSSSDKMAAAKTRLSASTTTITLLLSASRALALGGGHKTNR
ncbi:hypothetical protein BaRGS_00013380 [Batillaria attramentaria]|uniref:Uncharacterized protein n=1 Tax=Batillaria attramentaria TaxID=370345 RepID=A0ABD0L859_9CAEN